MFCVCFFEKCYFTFEVVIYFDLVNVVEFADMGSVINADLEKSSV